MFTNFMLYCRLIYMLSMPYVRLTIKVKVEIPESFKVGWYPHKKTGSSHLNTRRKCLFHLCLNISQSMGGMCYLTPDNSRRFRWLSVAFESSHSDTHDEVTY